MGGGSHDPGPVLGVDATGVDARTARGTHVARHHARLAVCLGPAGRSGKVRRRVGCRVSSDLGVGFPRRIIRGVGSQSLPSLLLGRSHAPEIIAAAPGTWPLAGAAAPVLERVQCRKRIGGGEAAWAARVGVAGRRARAVVVGVVVDVAVREDDNLPREDMLPDSNLG